MGSCQQSIKKQIDQDVTILDKLDQLETQINIVLSTTEQLNISINNILQARDNQQNNITQ